MAVRGSPLVTGRRSWPGVPGSITTFRTTAEGPIATGVDNLRPVVRRQYSFRPLAKPARRTMQAKAFQVIDRIDADTASGTPARDV